MKQRSQKKQENYRKTSTSDSSTMQKQLTVNHNKLQKILKELGILDYLICLLRNPYSGKEAAIRILHGTTDLFKTGKKVRQGCTLLPCLFNLYAEYIM